MNEFLSVVFVTSGTRGDRLLFKYPFEGEEKKETSPNSQQCNPYAVKIPEDLQVKKGTVTTTKKGVLVGLSDNTLANLLGVKSHLLCGKNFDVKIDEVRFVGFPLLLDDVPDKTTSKGKTAHKILSFNVVFVLQATYGSWVVNCYHELAKKLMLALKHEEKRSQYLSSQAKIMTLVHDEVTSLPEDRLESPFQLILQKSQLAQSLRQIYESLGEQGVVHLYVNNWIEVYFCLPHKLHSRLGGPKHIKITPQRIQECLENLRPYHGMLLLDDETSLLENLPIDCSPALIRLIQVANPLRSLQTLALEADLSLSQVFQLVCHLVYWAKATIIYPLCETNTYVLASHANTKVTSTISQAFVQQFEGMSLPVELSEFSFPTQLGESQGVFNNPRHQDTKIRMVVWMLQHHLLMQLHTYIFFVPPIPRRKKKISDESVRMPMVPEERGCEFGIYETGLPRSPSFSDAASGTSEESFTMSSSGIALAQISKSPSSEFTGDSSLVSEETKAYWILQDPAFCSLNQEEKDSILNVPSCRNLDDVKMFSRLFPYFNGKHHIEEIMYYENMRRSQLLTIIDKFREVLILCAYQDPATMFYSR